ncbi:MAG: clan AA aspartic protease [Chloroflexi bacterium]|nr:clan AA aspartic protease [Chloroflexota bacterium]
MSVIDAHGELQRCEVIADTGFTGWLTLPEADIRRLGLAGGGYRDAVTASGNMERFDYYETSVSWHGRLHEIEVFQSIDQPLLGMELLEGSRVCVVARDGGEVVIAAE